MTSGNMLARHKDDNLKGRCEGGIPTSFYKSLANVLLRRRKMRLTGDDDDKFNEIFYDKTIYFISTVYNHNIKT